MSLERGPVLAKKIMDAPAGVNGLSPVAPENVTYSRLDTRLIPRATGEVRKNGLDTASLVLTKPDPLTTADVFRFADAMQNAAGSIQLGGGESMVVVPDILPKTDVQEVILHQNIDASGPSLNIVVQNKGDKDSRYVLGENFGRGSNHTTAARVEVGSSRNHPYERRGQAASQPLDLENDNEGVRELLTTVYVKHLAHSGEIKPEDALHAVHIIEEGAPIQALETVK